MKRGKGLVKAFLSTKETYACTWLPSIRWGIKIRATNIPIVVISFMIRQYFAPDCQRIVRVIGFVIH